MRVTRAEKRGRKERIYLTMVICTCLERSGGSNELAPKQKTPPMGGEMGPTEWGVEGGGRGETNQMYYRGIARENTRGLERPLEKPKGYKTTF